MSFKSFMNFTGSDGYVYQVGNYSGYSYVRKNASTGAFDAYSTGGICIPVSPESALEILGLDTGTALLHNRVSSAPIEVARQCHICNGSGKMVLFNGTTDCTCIRP